MAFATRTCAVSLASLSLRRTLAYRKGSSQGLRPKGFSSSDHPMESPQEVDDTLRQFEDVVASETSGGKGMREHLQEAKRQEKRSADFLKMKIIKAKYFKDEPELNILTWAAKEQMRYLHAQYPDEWTVEKLLAAFPVSRYALNRILLSQQIADDVNEIEKHDRRVRQRWQRMLSPDECPDEKLSRTLRSLVESGRICRIMNAGGIKDHPYPPVRTLQGIAEDKPSPRGAFSLLFERCTQHVQDVAHSPPRLVGSGKADALGNVGSGRADGGRNVGHKTSERTVEVSRQPQPARSARTSSASGPPAAAAVLRSAGTSASDRRSPGRQQGQSRQQLLGDDDAVLAGLLNMFEPDFRRTEAHAAAEQLTYGRRASAVAADDADEMMPVAELYTYDPVKGYQTPFGKISSIPETVPVAESVRSHTQRLGSSINSSSSVLIRKGNDFYSSDGEYLYSVP